MEKRKVRLLTDYLREIIDDIIDDSYFKVNDSSNYAQIDYIISFLTFNQRETNKYFEPYNDVLSENMYSYYKQLMIRLMITDFYEYQTIIKKRGRQSVNYGEYYEFIHDNLDNPQELIKLFISKRDIDFNRSIVQNYIVYVDENLAFSAQAIKEQIIDNNVAKLNKINPFYICEVWHFFELNKITEAEEIKNEVLQSYYDEYFNYIRTINGDYEIVDSYLDEEYDEDDDTAFLEFDENEDYDENIIEFDENGDYEESIIEFDEYENSEYTEKSDMIIGRLTKLHIIQNYLTESKKKLFDVISYMIGNVYENIIYEDIVGHDLSVLKKEVYKIIDNASIKNIINLFIKDDDFSTLIIDFFIDYNEYFNDYDFQQQRQFIDASPYKVKIKKYNKHYNEENTKVEGLTNEIL